MVSQLAFSWQAFRVVKFAISNYHGMFFEFTSRTKDSFKCEHTIFLCLASMRKLSFFCLCEKMCPIMNGAR